MVAERERPVVLDRDDAGAEEEDEEAAAAAVTAAKTRFDKAVEAVREAAKANPVKVLACSGAPELFYASNPAKSADLAFYKELGVDLIVPDKLDKEGYFESLSWENADKYQPDLVLVDDRAGPATLATAEAQPTWKTIRAVEKGQVGDWPTFWMRNYRVYAQQLEKLTATINATDETVGD